MSQGITKEMYIRTLTDEEYKAVQKKSQKEIKEITGFNRSFMVGDSMVMFEDEPVKHGLYKFAWKDKKEVFYIVQEAYGKERAFCYSIY